VGKQGFCKFFHSFFGQIIGSKQYGFDPDGRHVSLFSHAQDLAYATSLDAAFDEKTASSGITIPFHPGAAAYYAGQGISVNTK